ncbi:AAA family ATPase [uncultured Alistipes sp.]|uniref:AAA family ATPase n=1 Tax=uncultured Alistipes sp. TaxID=538949 RepID=UPI0027295064|nr:AAA family ATPase [uncultured Alistipes sp.]
MIRKITINGVATYTGNPVEIIPNKINIIYGANGSGKTTISNIIEEIPIGGLCAIEWERNNPLKTYVYNSHFKELNFGESRKLKGVFTLGQASKEEKKKIDDVRQQYNETREHYARTEKTLTQKQQERDDLEAHLERVCWNKYRKYHDDFIEVFYGSAQKKTFKDKIKQVYSTLTSNTNICKYEDLKQRADSIFKSDKERLFPFTILESALPNIEAEDSWKQPIVGKKDVDIAALIEYLGNSDWVNSGRQYVVDIDGSSKCPFCQQPLSDSIRNQIEDFFDAAYTNALKKLNSDLMSYKDAKEEILQAIQTIIEQANSYIDCAAIETIGNQIESCIQNNMLLMERKIKEPSSIIEITNSRGFINGVNAIVKAANRKIDDHNVLIENLKTSKDALKNDIWIFVVSEIKPEYDSFYKNQANNLDKAIAGLSKKRDEQAEKCKKLKSELEELEKNMTSIEPTINAINKMLSRFGFSNFKLDKAEEKGYYQIVRENGEIAMRSLSEGEKTFITFLYFMQLIKGAVDETDVSAERVVVFDDPISSLDSNILFIVSTLIKSCICATLNNEGNIKQIFILTHNVYFHKEVSFLDRGKSKRNGLYYWILKKNNNISEIVSYERTNPISSSYELLWKEIMNNEKDTSPIIIQNTMRRIIESYFKVLGGFGDEDIIGKFSDIEDQQICRSLLCWINDGSHLHNDDLYLEVIDSSVEKYMKVFKDIFYKNGHSAHYDMMCGKVKTNA